MNRPPQPYLDLRARLLRLTLIGSAGGAAGYLLLAAGGVMRSRLFPWDGLGVLVLCAICGGLLQRNQTGLAAACFLAGISQPACYAGQAYGVASPVNATFLLGIVLCGLLIGGWFLSIWTAAYCGWMALLAWGELQHAWHPATPVADGGHMLRLVLFWWALFAATGWVVWLFARSLERAAEVSRGQTIALARTLQALSTEPELDTFLGQVLTVTAEQLGGRWATLWLYEAATDSLVRHLGYGRGRVLAGDQLGELGRAPIAAQELPIWQEIARTHQPIIVADVANDPRLKYRAQLLADNIRTLLYLPLLRDDQAIGMFSINSTERRRFRPEEIELGHALVGQMTLAIQLTRLAASGQQAAVLEERNRLAREIHDTLAQGFTGIVIQLEAAEDSLAETPDGAREHLNRARALARSSLAEARRSVHALRPLALDTDDLAQALARLVQEMTAGAPIQAQVHVYGPARRLSPAIESHLLRIGQEALTNALKYAEARQIRIALTFQPDTVELQVADDGRGFDPQAPPPRPAGGFGLRGMRERVAQLGGEFSLVSRPGAGTEVRVRVGG